MSAIATAPPLLAVRNLAIALAGAAGPVRAVEGLSFTLAHGRALGLVGESGSGKSLTALSIMRLAPEPAVRIAGGEIRLNGLDLVALDEAALRSIRGAQVSMVFQEPVGSLNPVLTVGFQVAEAIRLHRRLPRAEVRRLAIEALDLVGIPSPEQRLRAYPHQLSGGMCQRVAIAIALACRPTLLIADEPTTALDVTTQAQVLDLITELRRRLGMALILISHNLGVIAGMVDEVLVMYAGGVVESGPVRSVLDAPAHPYTAALLAALPAIDQDRTSLAAIPGTMPGPADPVAGCRFHPRCPRAIARCSAAAPALTPVGEGHLAACWLVEAAR